MNIIIGASRNNKIGSKLISWWLGTQYSHVYTRWHLSQQDREIVYQASHGMVHFTEVGRFMKSNKVVVEFSIPLSAEQFKVFSAKCIDLAGEKYSKAELLQIFLYKYCGNAEKFKDHKGYICSELMGKLLVELGMKFDKPLFLLTPKDIVNALSKTAIIITT
jgi:hypothetical protein